MAELIIVSEGQKLIIMRDLLKSNYDNVTVTDYFVKFGRVNPFGRIIRKLHCSNKINGMVKLPLKQLWSPLKWFKWDKTKKYIVLFYGIYTKFLSPKFLMSLKNKYNIDYAVWLGDCMASPYSSVSKYYIDNIPFKYIFTFDLQDARKKGFLLCDYRYSPLYDLKLPNIPEYDLYYCGRNEAGRVETINAICRLADHYNVTGKIRLHGVPRKQQTYKSKIIYNEYIGYEQLINETLKANCILEIPISGQTAPTLRYQEAVCYNKKLLTSNQNVVNMPFYNPEYIHIFNKPEDIDWGWVKERIPVDYHYDGRFSPTRLVDRIMELEEESEKQKHDTKPVA